MLTELDKTHVTSVLFDFHSKVLPFAEMNVYKYLTTSFTSGACNLVSVQNMPFPGFSFQRGV